MDEVSLYCGNLPLPHLWGFSNLHCGLDQDDGDVEVLFCHTLSDKNFRVYKWNIPILEKQQNVNHQYSFSSVHCCPHEL